jgi:hypothetical protein
MKTSSLAVRRQYNFALIKKQIGVLAMLQALQIPFRGHSAQCPFHKDNYSMAVEVRTNRVHCMVCMERPIDIFELAQRQLNLADALAAAHWIVRHFDLQIAAAEPRSRIPRKPERAIPGWLFDCGYMATLSDKEFRVASTLLRHQRDDDSVMLSYAGIKTYSGVKGDGAISNALKRFERDGWLLRYSNRLSGETGYYVVRLGSECFQDLIAKLWPQTLARIEEQKKKRRARRRSFPPFGYLQEENPDSIPNIDSYTNQTCNRPT